jgi:predicted dehydrogenase
MAVHKVAVYGCGYWGKNLVRNFHALGALAGVVDPSPAGREQAAKLVPGVPVYEDPAAVLADASIAGVVVATPAETHAVLCDAALRAGKDVLCEKPLALRYEDARRVAVLAEARGKILMVGHILEYHPAILKLRELIADGQLGKIRYIYSNRLNLGKVRREENILWSFAPHDVAIILRLVGQMPFQVVAAGGAYIQPNVADVTVTQLLFDNGVAAHLFVSWLNPFKEQKLVVVGSQKMAVFDDVHRELVLHDQRVDLKEGEPIPMKGEGTRIAHAADEPLRLECEAFLRAIDSREPPTTDARSALDVLRVLQAAQRSLIMHGQPVPLPME